ncbi:MAG: hypothetical protein AAF242_07170 [Bacteroidota bacterium]
MAKNCFSVRGEVAEVYSACCLDISLRLKNDDRKYYINRGLEDDDVNLREMRNQLIGKEVELNVIRRNWTPLDPYHVSAPVAEIRAKETVVFSRMSD